jgi:hypothetical protein
VFLTSCDHVWPVGHAKKLFGYLDNDPCWVHVSPAGDAALSVYERDALLTDRVPLRWRQARGDGSVWLADTRPEPSGRCVLWTLADPISRLMLEAGNADDEDRRGGAPAIVLGPSEARRCAVGLHDGLVRLDARGVVEETAPAEAWELRSAAHAVVHRAPGRLLGGWGRWATVWRDGRLFRVDLEGLIWEPLGECAVPEEGRPVAGTAEVMLTIGGLERRV